MGAAALRIVTGAARRAGTRSFPPGGSGLVGAKNSPQAPWVGCATEGARNVRLIRKTQRAKTHRPAKPGIERSSDERGHYKWLPGAVSQAQVGGEPQKSLS